MIKTILFLTLALTVFTSASLANTGASTQGTGGTTVGNGRERVSAIKIQFLAKNGVIRNELKTEIMRHLSEPFAQSGIDQFMTGELSPKGSLIVCVHFQNPMIMREVLREICEAIQADNHTLKHPQSRHSTLLNCNGSEALKPIQGNDRGC